MAVPLTVRRVEMHEGLRREFEIDTLSVDMWHVLEYEQYQMEPPSYGQLHDNDTYVIRWHYRITQSGTCLLACWYFLCLSICVDTLVKFVMSNAVISQQWLTECQSPNI